MLKARQVPSSNPPHTSLDTHNSLHTTRKKKHIRLIHTEGHHTHLEQNLHGGEPPNDLSQGCQQSRPWSDFWIKQLSPSISRCHAQARNAKFKNRKNLKKILPFIFCGSRLAAVTSAYLQVIGQYSLVVDSLKTTHLILSCV